MPSCHLRNVFENMKFIVIVLLASVVFPLRLTAQEVHVSLNSTLANGKFAVPNQVVIFTCVTRGANALSWSSTEYIGMGNVFQIASIGAAVNPTRGTTVASRIDSYDDNGVRVIVSQLRITALLQFPTSSVTCQVNGEGPSETINFITTEAVAMTTSTVSIAETESVMTRPRTSNSNVAVDGPQQQEDSSFMIYVAAGAGAGGGLVFSVAVVVAVIITIIVVIIKKRRDEIKKNSIGPKNDIDSCSHEGNNSTHKRSSSKGSETSSNDSDDPLT